MSKVIIELDFDEGNGKRVLNCDVYDYLQDLIADESLDYTVHEADGSSYGVIDYREVV